MSTKEITMPTKEIANRLVELCSKGDWETAQRELFAQDCVSIEPYSTPEFEKETKGLDAIIKKAEKFTSMVEENHALKVSQPLLADNSFAVTMFLDVTMKGQGRMAMTELCVYKVKDGKITSEEFFV